MKRLIVVFGLLDRFFHIYEKYLICSKMVIFRRTIQKIVIRECLLIFSRVLLFKNSVCPYLYQKPRRQPPHFYILINSHAAIVANKKNWFISINIMNHGNIVHFKTRVTSCYMCAWRISSKQPLLPVSCPQFALPPPNKENLS